MATQATPTSVQNNIARYDLSELSVLHIDENKHVRDVVRAILFRLGIKYISSVESVELGLARLQHHPTDLILYGWPACGQNGVRFTHALRRNKHVLDPYVPIVLVSSRVEFSRAVQTRDEGTIEFFGSPISASALYARITRIVDNQSSGERPTTYFGSARQSTQASV